MFKLEHTPSHGLKVVHALFFYNFDIIDYSITVNTVVHVSEHIKPFLEEKSESAQYMYRFQYKILKNYIILLSICLYGNLEL